MSPTLADGTWTGTYRYDEAGCLFSIGNANPTSGTEPEQYISSILYNARGQTAAISYGRRSREGAFLGVLFGMLALAAFIA